MIRLVVSVTVLDIFTYLVFFQCSAHVSQPHGPTRDTHAYTLTIFRDFKIPVPSGAYTVGVLSQYTINYLATTKSQKSGHVLAHGLSRPHSTVPQTMYWSQTESSKCSPVSPPFQPAQPFMKLGVMRPQVTHSHLNRPHAVDLCPVSRTSVTAVDIIRFTSHTDPRMA